MRGDVIGFGTPTEISRGNLREFIDFARCSGDALCISGFERKPCAKCGFPSVVGMSFISKTNDLYFTSCAVCGAVHVEAPIYDLGGKTDDSHN